MKDQKIEAIRILGQINLAKTVDFEEFELTPHVSVGLALSLDYQGHIVDKHP